MVEIRIIKSKNGNKLPVLVVNDIYVCFDKEKILRIADVRPSELDGLAVGEVIKL